MFSTIYEYSHNKKKKKKTGLLIDLLLYVVLFILLLFLYYYVDCISNLLVRLTNWSHFCFSFFLFF